MAPNAARPERATRGRRLSKLVDEEAEADEEFWGQDAFKEDEADNEYEEEHEVADEFDSDFNDDEVESDDGEVEERERPTKKRKLPPGKKPLKKGSSGISKKKGVSFLEEAAAAADAGEASLLGTKPAQQTSFRPSPDEKEDGETAFDVEGEKSLRKSTRTAVIVKQAEREAQRAMQQALPKIVPKKKKEDERKMTQEEMLLEAAQTEIQNRQSLEIMLAREEEVKRKAIINKEVYSGPLIRFHSRGGINILEFTKMADVPEVIRAKASPYPRQPICVITGLPAKYRDPRSGLPYATKEAFVIIRQRLRKGENPLRKDSREKLHQRKRTKVEREILAPGARMGVTKIKVKFKRPVDPALKEATTVTSQPQNQPTELEKRTSDVVSFGAPGAAFETPGKLENPAFRPSAELKDTPIRVQPPIPRAMVEANEADFMLEDLGVSLPSNLESGLSIQTSGIGSSMVQAGEMTSQGLRQDLHLEHEMLNLSPTGPGLPRFSEGYDLSIDGQSNSLLSLDVSWLNNS